MPAEVPNKENIMEPEIQYHAPAQNPAAMEYQRTRVNGESMAKLAVKRESAVAAAYMSGIVPFTIRNFNPVWLDVCCAHVGFKVPPAGHPASKHKTMRVGAIDRVYSEVVVANPDGYSYPTNVTNEGGLDPNTPDMTLEWKVVLPVEQAFLFERQYNNPADEYAIGGVLVFKGDGHLKGAKDEIVHVPVARRLPNKTFMFVTEPVSLAEKISQVLQRQRDHCIYKLSQAQDFSRKPELQGSIDNIHETWGQFAAQMGWQDIARLKWMLPKDADQSCPKCGAMRTNNTALFCDGPNCGRPWDAFAAFMAGEEVPHSYLAVLPEEQLAKVKTEMKRRKDLFAT